MSSALTKQGKESLEGLNENLLRATFVIQTRKRRTKVDPIWDKQGPDGTDMTDSEAYHEAVGAAKATAGALEIAANARTLELHCRVLARGCQQTNLKMVKRIGYDAVLVGC